MLGILSFGLSEIFKGNKTTSSNNIKIIKKTIKESLNETNLEKVFNQTLTSNSECITSNINNLSVANNSKKKLKVLNISNNTFNQNINTNLECLIDEKILQEITLKLSAGIFDNLVNNSEIKLDNSTNVKTESQLFGGPNTTNTSQTSITDEEVKVSLSNIFNDKIIKNININSIKKCISSATNNMNIADNIDEEVDIVNIEYNTTIQSINTTSKCIFSQQVVDKIVEDITQDLKSETTVSSKTDVKTSLDVVTKSSGLTDILDKLLPWNSLGGLIIFIILIVGVIFLYFMSSGDNNDRKFSYPKKKNKYK